MEHVFFVEHHAIYQSKLYFHPFCLRINLRSPAAIVRPQLKLSVTKVEDEPYVRQPGAWAILIAVTRTLQRISNKMHSESRTNSPLRRPHQTFAFFDVAEVKNVIIWLSRTCRWRRPISHVSIVPCTQSAPVKHDRSMGHQDMHDLHRARMAIGAGCA